MNKSISTPQNITHISLLTYSTWLVAGVWLIFTGVMLIYKPPDNDYWFFNYFFGAVRLLIGVHALRSARSVAHKSSEPQKLFLRAMTFILLTIILILPLLLFIFQTSIILFGTYQPGELYRENIIRLVSIAICYMLATIYADWRLRK